MQKQSGFIHITMVVVVLLTLSVVGMGAYGVYTVQNISDKDNTNLEKPVATVTDSQPISIEEQPADSQDSIVVPTYENKSETIDSTAVETGTSSNVQVDADHASEPTARYARLSLYNNGYIDIPLNKGGSGTDGYFSVLCTKGGPGSEDNRPIITVTTIQGDKRVQICQHHTFPTTSPKSGTARLQLANNEYIDTSTNKGGSLDGYQPIECDGRDTVGTIVRVQTSVDVRRLELCSFHKFTTATVY